MIEALPRSQPALRQSSAVEQLSNPTRPAIQLASAIDRIRREPNILKAMHARADLLQVADESIRAGVDAEALLEPTLEAIGDRHDTVAGLAAIHVLGRIPGPAAEAILADLVLDAQPGYQQHAVQASHGRDASPWLIDVVSGALGRGGLLGMLAQEALARWATGDPERVLFALEQRLRAADATPHRRHLVETIGLVPGRLASLTLQRMAVADEDTSVRETAIAAYAERLEERMPFSIGALGREAGRVGAAVRRVRAQRRLARRGPVSGHDRATGIKVAQIHLGAVLDATVSRAGASDTGGVATLLSHLGPMLAARPRVAEVLTIGRTAMGSPTRTRATTDGHRYESVRLEAGEGVRFTSEWPSLVAARRGIRAALLATGTPDVIHLRMADPGSLASAVVARELRIPTVFTLAPDPHGLIEDAEGHERLGRTTFAAADADEALWYRADLVRRLADDAREVALFPRPHLAQRLHELVGIDIKAGAPRYTVVPEGIDVGRSDAAAARLERRPTPSVISDLAKAIEQLPASRQGLPVVVSVGRLHEVKGMARVVAAFAADEALASDANLIIVGGDLSEPTPSESEELAAIERLFVRHDGLRDRVILLGRRPNDDVALVLAAARMGWRETIAPGGAYVCGSRKEEFGLAIIEALAAGLPVVAPRSGGPASYVSDGVTGSLVDTGDPRQIAAGLRVALTLARDPVTAERGRALVADSYTIERMARTLAALYRISTGAGSLAAPVATEVAA